jgi:hypothetical protein
MAHQWGRKLTRSRMWRRQAPSVSALPRLCVCAALLPPGTECVSTASPVCVLHCCGQVQSLDVEALAESVDVVLDAVAGLPDLSSLRADLDSIRDDVNSALSCVGLALSMLAPSVNQCCGVASCCALGDGEALCVPVRVADWQGRG